MKKELLRYVMLGVAALAVGPVIGGLMGASPTLDGGRAMTALSSPGVGLALLVSMASVVIAGLWGALAGRLVGPRDAAFCFGAALGWAAWSQGELGELVRAGVGQEIWKLNAVEGLVLGAIAAAFGIVGQAVAGGDAYDGADGPGRPSAWVGMAMYVAAGLVGAWVLARHESVGQSVVAGAAAGILGATAARVAAPRGSSAGLLVGVALVAAAGPVVGGLRLSGDFERLVLSGDVPGLLYPLPMAWLSGQLMGLPLGIALAASLVDQADAVESGRKAARA